MTKNIFLLNLRAGLRKKYKNVKYVAVFFALLLTTGNGYAQRSFGSSDMFVFDQFFETNQPSEPFTGLDFLNKVGHEFYVYAGPSLTSLSGFGNGGFGSNFGLAYSCNFLPDYQEWAILVGGELGMYSSNTTIDDKEYRYSLFSIPAYSGDGFTMPAGEYLYKVSVKGGSETGRAFTINIPIMVRYQFHIDALQFGNTSEAGYAFSSTESNLFYVAAGVKIGIPLMGNFESNYGTAEIHGLNTVTNQEDALYGSGMAGVGGFGTYTDLKSSSKLENAKMSTMLALELGYMWAFAEKLTLYAGFYFDYGFTNISPMLPSPISAGKNADGQITVDGNLLKPDFHPVSATDAMHNMALGVSLRLSFKIPKSD